MKVSIFCCLVLTIVVTNCVNPINGGPNTGLNPFSGLYNNKPLNPLAPGFRSNGFPRRLVQFLPVPMVKKVTHHHIHHVIAHKGVVKSKHSQGNGFDLNNGDNKSDNQLNFKEYKQQNGLGGELNDNGFKSAFYKRGGLPLEAPMLSPPMMSGPMRPVSPLADSLSLLANSGTHGSRGIHGFIAGQRAEFVPIVIGLIDDSNLNSESDPNREYSSRSGVIEPQKKGFTPSKETIKLFENLAKMGLK